MIITYGLIICSGLSAFGLYRARARARFLYRLFIGDISLADSSLCRCRSQWRTINKIDVLSIVIESHVVRDCGGAVDDVIILRNQRCSIV